MRIPIRLVGPLLMLGLLGAACSPPQFLRDMAGGDDTNQFDIDPDAFPAPQTAPLPGNARMGAQVVTNEASWGLLLGTEQTAGGAVVLDVLPDSAAQAAGLEPGDVIVEMDGSETTNHERLLVILRLAEAGTHSVEVARRDGGRELLQIELAPSAGFALIPYLEERVAAGPDPVATYILAQDLADTDRAIGLLRGLLEEYPDFAVGHALLARRLLDRVNSSVAGGMLGQNDPDLLEATESIDRAVGLDPASPSLHRIRAELLLALGDPTKAEIDAAAALELDPSYAEAHYLLGTAQLSLSRPQDAIAPLHRAVRLDPFAFDYYVNLALCYRALGRESDTQSTLEAARPLADTEARRVQLENLSQPPDPA